MISHFFILNASGSMVYAYQREKKEDTNNLLILCSSLHSIRFMVSEVTKQRPVEHFYFSEKRISVYSTLTGVSFVFVCSENVDEVFKSVYKDYCDFVMLDPFHVLDMPINSEKFKPQRYF
ncbi:Trafficking protein particle complex subunit 4 [Nosema granulosis]|uniref:Trafficking protein particle complex subunit n=1 Tax=Nosema granulosis TaxID=83296 RepID=A0A9P6H0S7_9MICR|nr:Trafficking protein particle complex subunit 4 [Nosema granulosis]